jgi:hypothetical protein
LGFFFINVTVTYLPPFQLTPEAAAGGQEAGGGGTISGLQLRERRHPACLLYTIAAPHSLSILLSITFLTT